ncbi:hypothetical protein HDU80_010239 [Chytriomyces hyalinus]|nr:hypothetical protein HDU80_010239 [Chytriomyces hyalinus]
MLSRQDTQRSKYNAQVAAMVSKLSRTQFYAESPLLAPLRQRLLDLARDGDAKSGEERQDLNDDQIAAAFSQLVPISTYADYVSFVERVSTPSDSVPSDTLGVGTPRFLIHSSSTSGGKPKIFADYSDPRAAHIVKASMIARAANVTGRFMSVTSIAVKEEMNGIPLCFYSVSFFRRMMELEGVLTDEDLIHYADPWTGGFPAAIKLVKHYHSFLAVMALFALSARDIGYLQFVFGSTTTDLMNLMVKQWSQLVRCIEHGVLLDDLELEEELKPVIMNAWKANPERARELAKIDVGVEGWLKRVWPDLQVLEASCAGIFASAVPKIRFALGPQVKHVFGSYACTEGGIIGVNMQDPGNPHLFHIVDQGCIFEFMDLDSDRNLVNMADLVAGKRYALIISNPSNGLWRYNLEDIFEHTGYHPATNQPLMNYCGRDTGVRLMACLLSDAEVRASVEKAIFEPYGKDLFTGEYVSFFDDSESDDALCVCVEAESDDLELIFDRETVEKKLTALLSVQNELFEAGQMNGRVGPCIVRLLKPGSFAEFRAWKTGELNSSVGQVKVPTVVASLELKQWFNARML